MSKKLISCTSCKHEHPPRGGMFCIYAREARNLCTTLGVSEEEFSLHIDTEKIRVDSEVYLKDNAKPDTPLVISDDLIRQLVADNISQRDIITQHDEKLDQILASFEKLAVHDIARSDLSKQTKPVEADTSSDLVGKIAELFSNTASSAISDPVDLSSKLVDLLSSSKPATVASPVFTKVFQIRHDPVLQRHVAETHFTPLLHGDRSRLQDRGCNDASYRDQSPLFDSRSTERKRRKLFYFDLEPHMAFDSRSTDYCTFEDVLSANLSLVDTLSTQGYSVSCYLKHVRFLVDKSKVYNAAALIRYDQAVRERADVLGESTVVYGDHELVHRFLGLENIKSKTKNPTSDSKDSHKSASKRKLPVGLCWKWNFGRKCLGASCTLKHVCTDCYGSHRASDCPKAESKPVPPATLQAAR